MKSRGLWFMTAMVMGFVLLSALASAKDTITINKSQTAQIIIGFGACGNDSATNFYTKLTDSRKQAELLNLLYGTGAGQIGLTLFRVGIEPHVCNTQAIYNSGPAHWNWSSKWENNNKKMIDAIKGIYPGLSVFAVPWSPPAWMKSNTSTVQGTILSSYYSIYADYLYKWTDYSIKTLGFPIKYLSIENEPSVHPNWDCCDYTPEQMDAVSVLVAKAIHGTDGIHRKIDGVNVGAPETSTESQAVKYLEKLQATGDINMLDFIASHDYGIYQHTHPHVDLRPYSNGKPILQPEVCDGKHPDDASITDAIKWAGIMHDALRDGEGAFMFWWLASNSKTLKQIVKITGNASYAVPKRGWVFGQYSRFMRPGDKVIQSSVNSGSPLRVSASKDSSSNASIVVTNTSPSASIAADINILGGAGTSVSCIDTTSSENFVSKGNQTVTSGSFTYTFPPNSVTSFKE